MNVARQGSRMCVVIIDLANVSNSLPPVLLRFPLMQDDAILSPVGFAPIPATVRASLHFDP